MNLFFKTEDKLTSENRRCFPVSELFVRYRRNRRFACNFNLCCFVQKSDRCVKQVYTLDFEKRVS